MAQTMHVLHNHSCVILVEAVLLMSLIARNKCENRGKKWQNNFCSYESIMRVHKKALLLQMGGWG